MYLKNLTVFGFKSFANKTALNFLPGVTAIVGPNGCGKSNVSDAIRWVLGEQSAKALRGGEMADVIFNGTDGRKPLGMAEVSLTIGGVDEDHLRAAGVEVAYNEVTITRRVFRDGGSEYFVNKTPCRLKDVQQLFMGTGVGRTSYSIMAQGNITHRKAKDILRASQLALLGEDNKHVASDLRKAASGAALSPILLLRGDEEHPLIIADGYHRVCASYWIDENTDIPCILV